MEPAIRTASLTGYAGLARSLGLDPAALMASVGLDLADLDAPDGWIPGAQVARLLEASAEQAGCEDFGLRLAALRRLGALGPLSVVLRDEPDFRSALSLLARWYSHPNTGVLDLRLIEDDALATVQIWLQFGEPVPAPQALGATTASLLGIIRILVRADWTPLSACFAHPAPSDPRPYHRLFGPGVRFEQEFTGLTFPVRDLDAPVVTSDPSVRRYSQQFLETVMATRAETASDQARDVIEVLLPVGRASIEGVSLHLGVAPRVLQRRLASEGTSFSTIVHATRGRLAERYLTVDHYTLTEISLLLGFAAPSAFSRWFQQQFGTTPSDWRRSARAATP